LCLRLLKLHAHHFLVCLDSLVLDLKKKLKSEFRALGSHGDRVNFFLLAAQEPFHGLLRIHAEVFHAADGLGEDLAKGACSAAL